MNEPDEATASAMCSVTANPWDALRHFADARIALGRAGGTCRPRRFWHSISRMPRPATRCISRWMRRRCGRN